ncbi:UDP-glucose dehydrogenase family protein [Mycobacterium paraterrae]|uniref:UDP-glucose 6-dehydrogenase n=1 Tax=Mycobacterium paraterrae TaxID=577492 RepID=A0ABY3VKJ8_9MYCO|nr:nucleotide sugar dehydrogenase [Mycobacterium paraterrae]UMB67973.1 nucleotide sugar dehydrogenase [Mycobacterium paraterrae]
MSVKVGVVGAGYVGLTTAVCLAAKGIDTFCMDVDPDRVAALRAGHPGIAEPELAELMCDGLERGTLRFTRHYRRLGDRDIVFVCVPTPTNDDGTTDLGPVEDVVRSLAGALPPNTVVVVKSTVPVGTSRRLEQMLAPHNIHVVVSPEFLRESHAVADCLHPDRVVIGASADAEAAADRVAKLYPGQQILRMSVESAELAKYASNAFLAVKLSFVNSLAGLCTHVGADIGDVTRCMGSDERIGPDCLIPGPGWGGSCLPKDTAALLHTCAEHGVVLAEVESARRTNADQIERVTGAVRTQLHRRLDGAKIAALGLTFKAGTNDVRDSPAVAVCSAFKQAGAQVVAYDPRLDSIDAERLPVTTARDPYVAAKDADAVVVLTEWPEFAELDWEAVERRVAPGAVVIDTRNVVDRAAVTASQLICLGNGTVDGY